ncbi:MAG: AAA family ATPase [Desulfobacterales bacterium]|nr:AAA family ATPase [Desulfobacterales bacterium]
MLNHLYKKEIENTVLSSFIYENDDFFSSEFNENQFTENRILVFQSIREILNSGNEADLVSLSENLTGKVKITELTTIVDSPVSTTNLDYHYKTLENARLRREMYQAYTNGLDMIKNGLKPLEIDSHVKSKIINIETHEPVKAFDLAMSTYEEIVDEAKNGKEIGLKTGMRRLDNRMNGFCPQELIVVAGRPGTGKTSIVANWMRNFGFFNEPGIVFSLEMSNRQLMRRMMCDMGSVDGKYLFRGQIKFGKNSNIWKTLEKTSSKISEMPIQFDDTANMTIDKIYSRAKKAKTLNNIKYVVIDHLGLISGWTTPGQEAKAEITRMCKMMAKDLDCVVIILSQMNRNIEKREGREPKMSDLRDAGSIEQDADIIIFPDVPEKNVNGTKDDEFELADLYIAKTRRGRVGKIDQMNWQGHYFRYSDKN